VSGARNDHDRVKRIVCSMAGFWHEAWFFTGELFKFMSLFYIVWVPGFLLAGLRARRFCYQAWNSVLANPGPGLAGIIRVVAAGVVGSVGGKGEHRRDE